MGKPFYSKKHPPAFMLGLYAASAKSGEAAEKIMTYKALVTNRNVFIILLTTTLLNIASVFYGWFLPIYLNQYGLMFLVIIFVMANIFAIPPVFLSGLLTDVLGRRLIVIYSSAFYLMSFVLVLTKVRELLTIAAILFFVSSAISLPAINSLLGESCAEVHRGKAFSLLRLCGAIGGFVGSLLWGLMYNSWGIKFLVTLGILLASISFLIRLGLTETLKQQRSESEGRVGEVFKNLKNIISEIPNIFKDRTLFLIAIAVVIVSLGVGALEASKSLYVTQYLDVELEFLGLANAITEAILFIGLTLAGHVVDKLGSLKALSMALFCEGLTILALTLLAFIKGYLYLGYILVSIYAVSAMISAQDQVASDRMLIDLSKISVRGTTIASLACVKPETLKTIDHHAFLLIMENELTVIDPMSFCAHSLPWKWFLRFKDIKDLEDKLNVDIILLFNEAKSLIKVKNAY